MALYSYVNIKPVKWRFKKNAKFISLVFIFLGLGIMIWTLFPIVSFELYYAPKFGNLIKPVPNEFIKQAVSSEISQILGLSVDYTKASNWYPKAVSVKKSSNNSSYTLSIPKLGIINAQVLMGGEDLDKSLIHFTGSTPGSLGGPVIFGHSTIPFLYNPKDYKTIFTKLPDLENGDEIMVNFDNVTYRYKVSGMRITIPTDLSVLEQSFDNSYLTLITCVPPGTYLKRLIIKTVLVN